MIADATLEPDTTQFRLTGVQAEVRVGGSSPDKFVPNVNAGFRLGSDRERFFINLNRVGAVIPDGTRASFAEGQIDLDLGATQDRFRVLNAETLAWDVVYRSDPRQTRGDYHEVFAVTCSPGVTWHYQPPLTREEVAAGHVRPESVVGSYAIYSDQMHRTVDTNGNVVVDHQTGKLGHLYRPQVTDHAGKQTWGALDYRDGTLTVTIPGAFLDTAVFPVTLDPDFGYTSIGASSLNAENIIAGPLGTPGGDGTLTALTAYLQDTGTHTVKCALYVSSSSALVAGSNTTERTDITTAGWYTFTPTGSPSVSAIEYVPVVWPNAGGGNLNLFYDTVASAGRNQNLTYAANFPDPATFSTNNFRASVYGTYTESGGGGGGGALSTLTLMGVQ